MADSKTDGVVTFTIKISGKQLKETYKVHSIFVSNKVGRIPYSLISIEDGDVTDGVFAGSDSNDFKPGSNIEIYTGYKSDDALIFSGIIIKHGISIDRDGYSVLELECKDEAVKMTVGRKNANFIKKKDSDIISILIQNNGLAADVKATNVQYEELVQYYCTDWDFMMSRAEVNGLLAIVNNGKISVKKPVTNDTEVLTLTLGTNIIDFSAKINAVSQYKNVKGIGWDIKKQDVVVSDGKDPKWTDQGNLTREVLSEVLSTDTFRIQSSTSIEQLALKEWANAQFVKSNFSMITGHVSFCGSSKVEPGKILKLEGVGARFEGKVFITGVNHTIKDGDWITECEFGMSDEWFTQKNDVVAPPASGFLPGVEGLQIGKVMKLDGDPLQENRIQIKLPVQQADTEGVWARLSSFYASNSAGSFFIPEIDDEVIVGYFNNDPSQPVILGSLYSSKLKPPYEITKENFKRAILTKRKLCLEFDDEKKIITIKTPGKNQIVINDDEKKITISDQNKNTVTMADNGVTINSGKDITLKANGKISLDAIGTVDISSKADIGIKGNNVNVKANMSAAVKGSASAEISASGQTTVKGGMVMIN